MKWAGHVARMEDKMNLYRLLVGKPEGKGLLGRPKLRWIDNFKVDLSGIEFGRVDLIGLHQDR
jgi:hypothetical protein